MFTCSDAKSLDMTNYRESSCSSATAQNNTKDGNLKPTEHNSTKAAEHWSLLEDDNRTTSEDVDKMVIAFKNENGQDIALTEPDRNATGCSLTAKQNYLPACEANGESSSNHEKAEICQPTSSPTSCTTSNTEVDSNSGNGNGEQQGSIPAKSTTSSMLLSTEGCFKYGNNFNICRKDTCGMLSSFELDCRARKLSLSESFLLVPFTKIMSSHSDSIIHDKGGMANVNTQWQECRTGMNQSTTRGSPDLNLIQSVRCTTRDIGTLTSPSRWIATYEKLGHSDAGVQANLSAPCRSVGTNPKTPFRNRRSTVHVFPEVSLEFGVLQEQEKSPVREVKWDDKGMTWEVYGASMDAEVLGLAIQKHLENQIEQHIKELKSPGMGALDVIAVTAQAKRRQSGVFRALFQNIRQPKCFGCTNPTMAE